MKHGMKRRSTFLAAAMILAASLSACSGNSGQSNVDKEPSVNAEKAESNEEIVKLKVWGFGYNSTSEDMALVSEAASKITREKLGVEVEIVRSSDKEKLNLAMNSGEPWDLVCYHNFSGGLATLVNNGMAMPIDDLAEEYGKDAMEIVGEKMMNAGKVNGVLYSIPSIDVWANSYGMAIRSDILEELNIDPETLKTWDDLHDAFVKMKEAYPDRYPVVAAWPAGGMQKTFAWDNLGTGFWDALGILKNCHDSSTTVVNMYETDEYRELCEMMYQWNQEGLLMPDATTTTEVTKDLLKTVGFAAFDNITPVKKQEIASGKYWKDFKGVGVAVVDPFITSDAGGSSYFIPTVCEHPEKAMQLWNLMYTDKELADIISYGIEGRDFEYTDENRDEVRINQSSTYGSILWSWPNQTIASASEGVDKNIWAVNKEFRDSASISPALGFKFDSSGVMNEITACNNVIAKYEPGLRWGELDPSEALPKFNEELYAAGLQTVIDAKQQQLDEFLSK